MDDRKRIANAIITSGIARIDGAPSIRDRIAVVNEVADAVLADLGDRLLPELPEGWHAVHIKPYGGRNWEAILGSGSPSGPNGSYKTVRGYGPTIAAAIRAAIDEVEADE